MEEYRKAFYTLELYEAMAPELVLRVTRIDSDRAGTKAQGVEGQREDTSLVCENCSIYDCCTNRGKVKDISGCYCHPDSDRI